MSENRFEKGGRALIVDKLDTFSISFRGLFARSPQEPAPQMVTVTLIKKHGRGVTSLEAKFPATASGDGLLQQMLLSAGIGRKRRGVEAYGIDMTPRSGEAVNEGDKIILAGSAEEAVAVSLGYQNKPSTVAALVALPLSRCVNALSTASRLFCF